MIVDLDLAAAPNARRLAGLSTERKPVPGDLDWHGNTNLESGATFLEVDTGRKFLLLERTWELMRDAFEEAVLENQKQLITLEQASIKQMASLLEALSQEE